MENILESFSPEDTYRFGEELGKQAQAGQVYCLNGDLGVGKTIFTQGFAVGLGISEIVDSPTFTIVQVYEKGRLDFYHFDVYRISDVEELYEIGADEYLDGDGVCLVEWAQLIPELIPEDAIFVQIEKNLEKGLDYRKITIKKG